MCLLYVTIMRHYSHHRRSFEKRQHKKEILSISNEILLYKEISLSSSQCLSRCRFYQSVRVIHSLHDTERKTRMDITPASHIHRLQTNGDASLEIKEMLSKSAHRDRLLLFITVKSNSTKRCCFIRFQFRLQFEFRLYSIYSNLIDRWTT